MSEREVPISGSDIAIVGLACRYPASPDAAAYWRNLRDGVECIQRYSDEELRAAGVPDKLFENPNYVKAGGPLDGVDLYDAGFFGFGPKDAAVLDPQHRHFMEVAWEALENAGHPPARFPGSVGVFAGCGMNAYFMFNLLNNPELIDSTGLFLLRHTGNDRDFMPTMLSYKLNLTGPSVAVQCACSTSLVAIHFSCQSLLSGECDLALAGGVTIEVPHRQGYLYREGEVLTPDGHCCTFDARATGTLTTSGVGVVALRRLADAIEDGDTVRAVIKGSAVNNDGAHKVGFLAPSVDGQAAVIAEALAVAEVSADSISYVESHGTGTAVGDPIEISALTQAYRATSDGVQYCAIGSNKPNIGHTDNAAGVASIIKVVGALEHRQLPPSINFHRPNPDIDFESSPFFVNTELVDWEPRHGVRRAGVSSLGVGGTNAHLILEEAPDPGPREASGEWQVLPLSAKTASALDQASENLVDFLDENPGVCFADVAHTLQVGREDFEHRRVLVSPDAGEAVRSLRQGDAAEVHTGRVTGSPSSVVFMFPGAGGQYPNMGLGLYESEPVFREVMDRCLELVAPHVDDDLGALLYPGAAASEEHRERLAIPVNLVPAVFSTEYALAKLWMSWGIEPDAMTGHSLGEFTAACLAGVMTLEDALAIVALRGRLVGSLSGRMLSVPLPEQELAEIMSEEIDLAVVNGPSLCVVSALDEPLAELEDRLRERDIECRVVPAASPGHCRLLDPILPEFREALWRLRLSAPERPYISNLSGTWITAKEACDPEYWVRHFRNTVRFSDGLATLLESGDRVLLEVGPGQTLSTLARQQPKRPRAAVPSLRRSDDGTPDARFLRGAFGRLWASGVSVSWSHLRGDERRRRMPLPTYPFERQRYWIEPTVRPGGAAATEVELERLENVSDWFYRPVWRREELPARDTPPADEAAKRRWLVFADAEGLAARMIDQLEAVGHEVIVVREGDAFYELGCREYAIAPEGGVESYSQLIEELARQGLLPDRIAHFWLATPERRARPGSSFFHHVEERGFYSLLFLAQALGGEDLGQAIHVGVVTNGMQAIGDELLRDPEKATVLGPVRVIPQELPGLSCQSIDVALPRGADASGADGALRRLAEQLALEIHPDRADTTVAYRGDERFVEDFEPVHTSDGTEARIREGGVYLVTGGLGGLGLELAGHLARTARAKLALIGRTPLPEREDWERWLESHGSTDPTSQKLRRLLEIEDCGSELMVVAADVANVVRMREVLDQIQARFGTLHGVFHAAGSVDDAPLQAKTQSSIQAVFTPKIQGTLVLDELLRESELELCVLFSSTSSHLGPAGQVDYVAACSFLNAFARSRAQRESRYTVALDWGVWRDAGAAVEAYRRLGGPLEAGRPAQHPLLDRRIAETSGGVVFSTELEVSKHWVLDEHRTRNGQALIPGTGYLAMARAALAELADPDVIDIRNAFFVAPLRVGDDETVEARITLRPDDESYEFEIESRLQGGSEWELHAQGSVEAAKTEPPPPPLDLQAIAERCPRLMEARGSEALRTSQEDHLRFGPRWRCARALRFGTGEALGLLELPEQASADLTSYPLHPALLDIATGYGLSLIPGYSGQQLYAPFSYKRVRVFGPLSGRVYSWVRSDPGNGADREVASFDVTVADEGGRVLVEVEGFTVRRLDDVDAFDVESADDVERARSVAAGAAGEIPSGGDGHRLSAGERVFQQAYELGIRPEEGLRALRMALSGGSEPELIISSMAFPSLLERFRSAGAAAADAGGSFARPELESAYIAPRDAIETRLAGFWTELLGVDKAGIEDDFFELGGHSLIAVRLFAKIKKAWDLEYSLSLLFEAPTIETSAALIRCDLGVELGDESGEPRARRARHRFLVNLQSGAPERPPFFLVSGMFGNVLNLRHIAAHLGADQTTWAIQAKGLLGDDEPHRRFEEMARDYLEEVRSIQPRGPYYLGGFSGGGITAYEMARQLRAAGEVAGCVILLDTLPAQEPPIRVRDRLMLQWRRLQRRGPRYLYEFVANRIRWERERRARPPSRDLSPAEFRSERIEIAFREALAHYRPPPYAGALELFRPPLAENAYELYPDRFLNDNRVWLSHDNRWGAYASRVEVHEVTGNHDSMVLEPHVRVLAGRMREVIDRAIQASEPPDER